MVQSTVLRIASPEQVIKTEQATNAQYAASNQNSPGNDDAFNSSLVAFIDNEFNTMQRHRDGASGWSDRLVAAMRTFNGQYDNQKLQEIRKFGGSEIFARLTATKCRGATSLLRDVYLNTEKPWALQATPDPVLPDNVMNDVMQLVQTELANNQRLGGPPPDPASIRDRVNGLIDAARRASLKKARTEAEKSFAKVDDLLVQGGFYEALAAFLVDLPLFPFACIKGPVVRVVPQVTWQNGVAVTQNKPRMFWYRVSPFDIWWTPGVSTIRDASVIERSRVTRQELNQLLGLPGYNDAAIREVLKWYGRGGYSETRDTTDQQRAQMESREDPAFNQSGLIDMLEYHGYVQGQKLLDAGMAPAKIPDPLTDYFVDVYKIGRYIIKVQMSPSLRKRPYYYVTSFEKVPGTVVGNALPDILSDIQDVTNAALRSLNNNMAMASGPQVVVNDDRVADNENGDEIYPWKRWHVVTDPLGNNSQPPVLFQNVDSHAQELLGVYEKFTQIADELSSIPRYITGSERVGGAGRTASGLAMLMGNAAKILQTVASNIDLDVIEPSIQELYDLIMLTDRTGILRGDEAIQVLGVQVAMQRETQRQRQLEFLQITMNPIDTQIMGVRGRANVLREISQDIGLPGEDIVPPDDEIKAQIGGTAGPGAPPIGPGGPTGGGAPGAGNPAQPAVPAANASGAPSAPQAPQTNVVGRTPGAGPGTPPNPARGPA